MEPVRWILWCGFLVPSPWWTHSQLCAHWLLRTPSWLLLSRTALCKRGPTSPRKAMLPLNSFFMSLLHAMLHFCDYQACPSTFSFCILLRPSPINSVLQSEPSLSIPLNLPSTTSNWILFISADGFPPMTLKSTLRDRTLPHSFFYSRDLALFLIETGVH